MHVEIGPNLASLILKGLTLVCICYVWTSHPSDAAAVVNSFLAVAGATGVGIFQTRAFLESRLRNGNGGSSSLNSGATPGTNLARQGTGTNPPP
jgi:hypothetical protein